MKNETNNKQSAPMVILAIIAVFFLIAWSYFSADDRSLTNKESAQELKMDDKDYLFEKSTECMDLCKKAYDSEKVENPTLSFINPNYAFNKELNACFYSGGWVNGSTGGRSMFYKNVTNCQTNEEMLSLVLVDNEISTAYCDTCAYSSEEYDKKEAELMQTSQ